MPRTPGTRRYIFNTLTVVSLLLLLATMGLWVLSYQRTDVIQIPSSYRFLSQEGGVEYDYLVGRSDWWYDHFDGRPAFEIYVEEWRLLGFASGRLEIHGAIGTNGVSKPFISKVGATVTVPHWFLTLIFAILPSIWFIKWRRRRKLGPNSCPSCGYDLTGNETGECPECGVEAKAPETSGFHSV